MQRVELRVKNRRIPITLYDVYDLLDILKENNFSTDDAEEIWSIIEELNQELYGMVKIGFGDHFFIYNKRIQENVFIYADEDIVRHVVGVEGRNLSSIKKQMGLDITTTIHVRPKKQEEMV